jgi:ABC-type branched-subunit amino acid transport system substrate-binding protein
MERKKVLWLLIPVTLVLVLVALPFMTPYHSKAVAADTKTLRIGVMVCLTGWFSTFDTLEWEEAQVARDMLNERGGITIDGQKYLIELIAEDCKSTNEGVVAAATKLVYDKKVKFIAGPAAFFSAAANQITESNKVLRTSAFTCMTPEEFGPKTPYTFLCHNATLEHAIVGVTALKKVFLRVKKVDFVTAEAGGTVPFCDPPIRKLLKENGYSVVGKTIVYPDEMADFSPIAAKLATSGSDGVFWGNGLPEHVGKALKGLRELGYNKPVVFMSSASPEDIKRIAGEAASTYFATTGITLGMPDTPPIMAEMQNRLIAKYGSERSIHLQIVNCIWGIAEAIRNAQSLDPTVVRDTWEKLDTIETPYGTGHISGMETYGIRHAISHPEPYLLLDNGVAKFGGWADVRVP